MRNEVNAVMLPGGGAARHHQCYAKTPLFEMMVGRGGAQQPSSSSASNSSRANSSSSSTGSSTYPKQWGVCCAVLVRLRGVAWGHPCGRGNDTTSDA